MISKETAQKIWEQVKENLSKLNSCSSHTFGDVLGGKEMTHQSFPCKKCGGLMRSHDIFVYTKGYKAAGGNPDDVARFVDGSSLNE